PEKWNSRYLFYFLQSKSFSNFIKSRQEGSVIPHLYQKDFEQLELPDISKEEQNRIVYILDTLTDKIENNNDINDNLDILMTSMFENIFQNLTDQNFSTLSEIANFKNGLAMQKYRPQKQEDSLPVLKIRELNQGFTDKSSDRCSSDIDNKVIINAGDIVFSWSGTLLLKIWSGKKAGLNQHLFKVTSNRFPAWFIYGWTNHYMKKFKSIASYKATTMGHIKRSDLSSSKVIVPDNENLATLNKLFNPLFKKRIQVTKENAALLDLRRELLNHFLN
ncbi:restriction endonuclease subunit S, partial [Ligilactobacillus acidipiscis]